MLFFEEKDLNHQDATAECVNLLKAMGLDDEEDYIEDKEDNAATMVQEDEELMQFPEE